MSSHFFTDREKNDKRYTVSDALKQFQAVQDNSHRPLPACLNSKLFTLHPTEKISVSEMSDLVSSAVHDSKYFN